MLGRHRASSTSSTRSNRSAVSIESSSYPNGKTGTCDSPQSSNSTTGGDLLAQRLSSAELEVLKYSSNVNNNIFLPWIDDTDLKEKFAYPNRFMYVLERRSRLHKGKKVIYRYPDISDPDGTLRLSEKQMAKFGGWKRPTEFMKNPQLIRLISSTSIVQDVVTDCSFVASLCVAAAYERKYKQQVNHTHWMCVYVCDWPLAHSLVDYLLHLSTRHQWSALLQS